MSFPAARPRFFIGLCLVALVENALALPPGEGATTTSTPPAAATDQTAAKAPAESGDGETPANATQQDDAANTPSAEGDSQAPAFDPYAEAKQRVAQAETLYEQGNFDAALTEFQRAYDAMLGHPARSYVLYNIGRCQERLYRYDAAIESYRKYLEEAGPEAEDRGTVAAKIELLDGLLGTVHLEISAKKGAEPPTTYEVWVDGRLIGKNTRKFLIPSGNHEVEIRAEGYEPALNQVQVGARQEKSLDLVLSPLAKEYKGLPPGYFYLTGGVTLATAAIGVTYVVLMFNKRSEIDGKEGALVTEDDRRQLKHYALMADIFVASAGVLATSATVLAVLTDWSRKEQETPPRHVRVKEVGFAPLPGGGFLNLKASF